MPASLVTRSVTPLAVTPDDVKGWVERCLQDTLGHGLTGVVAQRKLVTDGGWPVVVTELLSGGQRALLAVYRVLDHSASVIVDCATGGAAELRGVLAAEIFIDDAAGVRATFDFWS